MTRRRLISFLLAVLLCIILIIANILSARGQCLDMDIVILGDFSGSVGGHEGFVLDAINEFSTSIKGGEGVRISVVLFADTPRQITDLSNDLAGLTSTINGYQDFHASGSTNIDAALQLATTVLLEEQNNSRKLIILISDGDVTEGTPAQTLATAGQVNSIGIGICAVLIKSYSQRPEFMKEVSSGCYVETDYSSLSKELKNLNICF